MKLGIDKKERYKRPIRTQPIPAMNNKQKRLYFLADNGKSSFRPEYRKNNNNWQGLKTENNLGLYGYMAVQRTQLNSCACQLLKMPWNECF